MVIRLLRYSYARVMPGMLPGLGHIHDERQWRRYLQAQYGRYWNFQEGQNGDFIRG
ncbi:putative transposase [Candidatus Erwinia dacicola]|uniref:Transposase n=1 Tax=Candidatus Erwinia dacicola TaxID=252393 RepID=A0A328TF02_9GAMM|nr:putative transposase [Candidatus Erwinia dacicola]